MHSPWEPDLNHKDQSSLQLESSALQPEMDYISPWTNYVLIIYLQGTNALIFCVIPTIPKSFTMQEMSCLNAQKI